MAEGKKVTLVYKGQLLTTRARKPPNPRRRHQILAYCASAALGWGARRYVVRMSGAWQVYEVNYPQPIREFPSEDAAAMWLLAKGSQ